MRLFRKHLNLDGPGAGLGGAPAAVEAIPPVIVPPVEAAGEQKKEIPLTPLNLDALKDIPEFGETPAAPKEGEKPLGAPKIEEKPKDEFTLDIDDAAAAAENQEAQESSWSDVAKAIGLEDIKEPTFEAFNESLSARLTNEREAGRKEGREVTMEKWTSQQKEFFEFMAVEGNTVEAFLNPLSVYDKYLALDDKSLLIEDYRLKEYDEAKIKDLIEELEVDNKLGNRAYELRRALELGKQGKQQELISNARLKVEQKNTEIREKEASELAAFKSELQATKDFMGIPVSERALAAIEQKFKDGIYRTRLANDPKAAVATALFLEFGDKTRDLLGNDLKDEGRLQILKKAHNVGLPASNAGRIESAGEQLQGFDAWERKLNEEKSTPSR